MSLSSGIDGENPDVNLRGRFFPDLIPWQADPRGDMTLGAVLQNGNSASNPDTGLPQDATDFDNIGCVSIETGKVFQGNNLALEIGEAGDTLKIIGAITKGSILVGNGAITESLPVGANGLVLKANSAQPLGVEWGTDASGGTVVAVNAGTNINVSGTIDQPIVNLATPLTSTLGMGSVALTDKNGSSGTSGQVLSAGTGGETLWATLPTSVASVSAGNNIEITGTTADPIVNLKSPLTSDLDIGSVQVRGSTTDGDATSNYLADANASTNAITQVSFTRTTNIIDGQGNIFCDGSNMKTNLRWRIADPAIDTLASSIETAQQNQYDQQVQVVDNVGLKDADRSDITIGGGIINQYRARDIDPASSFLNVAQRNTQMVWSSGIADSDQYNYGVGAINQRQYVLNSTTVSEVLNNNAGAGTTTNYSHSANSSNSNITLNQSQSGYNASQALTSSFAQSRHYLSADNASTQLTTIINQADTNRSRSEVRLGDGTSIVQQNRIDANGVSCSYEQYSKNIVGTQYTTTLITNATSGGAFLTTDGTLTMSSTGILNVNSSSTAGMSGTGVIIQASSSPLQLNSPASNIQYSSSTGQQVLVSSANSISAPTYTITNTNASTASYPAVKMDRPTPVSVAGDIIGSISMWADDGAGATREWSRIQTKTENVGAGNQDGTLSIFNSVNGVVSETFNFNGGQNENNSFRPLDMNNNDIRTSTGNILLTGTLSSGVGSIELKSKDATAGSGTGLILTGNTLLSGSSSGNSGQHLALTINGVVYKIALLNA